MKDKKVFLTPDDYHQNSWGGLHIKGGSKIMYEASLVVKFNRDGTHEVIKDRYRLSPDEVQREIDNYLNPIDRRLLLMM